MVWKHGAQPIWKPNNKHFARVEADSLPSFGRWACTEPHCLKEGARLGAVRTDLVSQAFQ